MNSDFPKLPDRPKTRVVFTEPGSREDDSKSWLWISLLILLVAVAGVGYFLFAGKGGKSGPAEKSGSTNHSSRNNQNGPYYHQLYAARSKDGLKWQLENKLLFDHASVPGAIVKDKTLYVYYVDASHDEDQLSVGISQDNGQTFTSETVSIAGVNRYDAVDPHPELVDGKIRLFYLGDFMSRAEKPESNPAFTIYSAESTDGISFTDPQAAIAVTGQEATTDPDVFLVGNKWEMLLSQGKNMLLANSTDGRTFTQNSGFSWNKGGVSDTTKIGNTYYTYYCGDGGIDRATGADKGQLKTETTGVITVKDKIVCDPSVVKLSDGTYLMFYKTQEMKKNQPL